MRWDGSQTDQGEVLDNSCHITSTSIASALKVMSLQLPSFLDASSTEHRICWKRTLKGILNGNLK